jgi:ATP-dependent DNA helicase Q1
MLSFAIDYTTCRKLLFDKYFGNPASVVAPFTTSDQSACGHCDNCLRSASTDKDVITVRDVTLDAWKVCKIFKAVEEQRGRVTLPQAADLVRGLGKGQFSLEGSGMGKGSVDLQELCGGKVELSKDVCVDGPSTVTQH